ncbi:MAG TPA: transposase [Candidatus Angelobacter sp.]
MPSRWKRYQQTGQLHYVTFTCYHRKKHLQAASARDTFEQTLERVRRWYGFYVVGYVVMPEHVHLLVSEPERSGLALALRMLKQVSSRKLRDCAGDGAFWQKRYYDFNVFSDHKRKEKLRYMHRNPVKRGFVEKPEDWKWSGVKLRLCQSRVF